MTQSLVPVARPRLPTASEIVPYLHEIDASGWYANFGPLTRRFQSRLAHHWGVAPPEVTLLASATVAITLALQASGARSGTRCLMPSWTFAASAGAVLAAGLVPHFVDVDPETWALDPCSVADLAKRAGVGAILVVAPFGGPLDLEAWDDVQRSSGLPVIIDAAAAFDTLRAGGPMKAGACPAVVSLHATKVFGIGEGGAVLCQDMAWLERIRRLSNFGFLGTREVMVPGLNGKMSEYAAAVGLAGLDGWHRTRLRWLGVTKAYMRRLPGGVRATPGFGEGWVSSTLSVAGSRGHADVAAALGEAGAASLRWWGEGCHMQPAFQHLPRGALPVTEHLARVCVGLPFWQDLSLGEIDLVCAALPRPAHAAVDRCLVRA